MIQAAIYARYSSDRQKDRSVEDQIAFCRDNATRHGMAVVSTFEDRQISGAGAVNRPGVQALMRAAEARLFDVIIAEDLDRLFRNQADYHAARATLDFHGIKIHTVAHGPVGELDGALRALVAEQYLKDLAVHTRRGLEGVIRDGRHAGGRAYGYRAVSGKPGELEIVEDEAEIVRQIFSDYVEGKTPRQIAYDLNKRGVRPPRGRQWNASTINGNASRGGGLILNDLYRGQIVWNKVRMVKDPTTRKRLSRPNTKEQYKAVEAPHLRIVDDATWMAAQAIKAARRHDATPATIQNARAPKRVFSGLIKCGSCGGGMASIGSDAKGLRLQCSTYRESGSCSNGRRVYLDSIEALAIKGLRQHLAHPEVIAEFADAYNAERKRLMKEAISERARLERRLGEIEREMNRIVDSIVVAGMPPERFVTRMQELEAEKANVMAGLESARENDNVIALHPKALDRYKCAVAELADHLKRGTPMEFSTIRELVSAIIVHASPSRPGGTGTKANAEDDRSVRIDIRGRLAALCGNPALFPNMAMSGGTLVAGERLEPPAPAFCLLAAAHVRPRD
ncbi:MULTISPECIES: recombinase family protein [Bradyrhizobium]|uniref:Recombinase family protein n=1 Tax=Bradyrhizobium elkanii TaxID=29448 RepID=A0A4U6RYX4_BRAEL|nr:MULTISPECIES: recombinase family protein [Bradyrhizobium]MTV16766.1 recombinase family protein [Bradyrhizobium sp. BR2003]TKV80457.1 recombinase family protein [Bradyrhizobium elkanii]